MRQLAQIGTEIADSAYNPMGRDARELLDEAETKVFRIAESTARSQQDFLNMEQILTEVVERVNELYGRDNLDDVTGIPTGFVDLDKNLRPAKGDLVIVAGRPSMGKTAFSMNIAENVALNTGLPVAVFSMEMGATQLAMRMIGSVGRLDQHALRTGQLSDEEMDKFGMAVSRLVGGAVVYRRNPGLSGLELRSRARRLARKMGGQLGLIVIDYLQLMSGSSDRRDQNRASGWARFPARSRRWPKSCKRR